MYNKINYEEHYKPLPEEEYEPSSEELNEPWLVHQHEQWIIVHQHEPWIVHRVMQIDPYIISPDPLVHLADYPNFTVEPDVSYMRLIEDDQIQSNEEIYDPYQEQNETLEEHNDTIEERNESQIEDQFQRLDVDEEECQADQEEHLNNEEPSYISKYEQEESENCSITLYLEPIITHGTN